MKTLKQNSSKKANVVGFAIIGLAFLLLLGSLTTTDNNNSSSSNNNNNGGGSSSGGGSSNGGGSNGGNNGNGITNLDLENSILFQLNETILGKEVIETSNYPNMKIGSSKIYEQIYYRNDLELSNTAFNEKSLQIQIDDEITNSDDFIGLLVMAYPKTGQFQTPLGIYTNNNLFSSVNEVSSLPMLINRNDLNKTNNIITLKTKDVQWFQIGKEYSVDFSEIIILAVSKDSLFSSRTIEFLTNTDEEHLSTLRLKLSVICPPGEDGSTPIEAYVNSFKVLSQNPTCLTRTNAEGTVLSAIVPKTILKNSEDDEKNSLLLETFGTYETSLQIEEVSFNDEYTYTFYLNNNKDLFDVILFADFDQEELDIQINSYRFAIPRKETISIKNRLRSSQNVLTIHDTPVEIKEFTIEQINER